MSKRLLPLFAVLAIAALLLAALWQGGQPEPRAAIADDQARVAGDESSTDAVSYALGYNIGRSLEAQGIDSELDIDEVVAGLRAGLGAAEPRMSEQRIQQVLTEFSIRMEQRHAEQRRAEAEQQRQLGEQFLTENRQRDGVMETPSGLQYQVVEPGEGASPGPEDTVLVHYTGRFIDGEVFDSSRDRGQPVRIPLDQVIAGWTEGMQLMQEGGRYKLFTPPDLAYGEEGRGEAMPPNATLIFDIELIEVLPAEE